MTEDDATMRMTLPELADKLRLMACHGGGTLTLDAEAAIAIASRLDRKAVRYQVEMNWHKIDMADAYFFGACCVVAYSTLQFIAGVLLAILK